jgi:hypothetical protein
MGSESLEYNVIVVKWGNKFTFEHVNRLYRMAKRNITLPFNFYCYTEDPTGIYNEVNIIPLDTVLRLEKWWWKTTLFQKNNKKGINLYLDLDVIIQSNIDHFFNKAIHDKLVLICPNYDEIGWTRSSNDMSIYTFPFYNSSIMIWYNNENSKIYEKFITRSDYYQNLYLGMDRFLSYEIDQKYFLDIGRTEHYSRCKIRPYEDLSEFNIKKINGIEIFYNSNRPVCVFNGCHEDIFYQGMEKFLL